MTTLIVAATPEEAAYIPDGLPVLISGVGKTATAARLAGVLTEGGVTEVVNVGTAGALRPGVSGLHLPGSVFNHEISADALRVLGYDPVEWIDLPLGRDTVLASGDTFVTDVRVRERLAQVADLVDMEGYAVAWTCRAFNIPVRLVKHVSDNADHEAMGWPDVVDRSARVLGDWLVANVTD
ncbi:nucleosidase [Nocardioides terrisoli]|uniref:nucleosidase n=1 Tax=Nocardioides terrisoli TaxID=3388267 RepID=UPI00287B7ECD|nr:nucleosidase [Nocardioides marmorisolisilvae]